MKGRVKLDEKYGVYFLLDGVVRENVESGRYKDIEAVCDVFVESLLWKRKDVAVKSAEKFDSSELSSQYIELMNDDSMRNLLIDNIHTLCQKFAKLPESLENIDDIGQAVSFAVKYKSYTPAVLFVRILRLLTTDDRELCEFKLLDDDVNAMLKMLVQAYYAVYYERVTLSGVGQSALTFEQIDDIFNFYANDIKLHLFLSDQKHITPLNRNNYYHLLTKPQYLTLKLCSPSRWPSHDIFFLGKSLNERSSVTIELWNSHSYGATENEVITDLISQLTNVKVFIPYHSEDDEKQTFKKLAKNCGREVKLGKEYITFLPITPRATETPPAKQPSTLTLFANKAKLLINPAKKHTVRPH